jgi:hypothetical protein
MQNYNSALDWISTAMVLYEEEAEPKTSNIQVMADVFAKSIKKYKEPKPDEKDIYRKLCRREIVCLFYMKLIRLKS